MGTRITLAPAQLAAACEAGCTDGLLRAVCAQTQTQHEGGQAGEGRRRLQNATLAGLSNAQWYAERPECHPMAHWSQARTDKFISAMGTATLQLGAVDAASLSAVFAAQRFDGAALAHVTAGSLRAMGVKEGLHTPILAHIARNTVNFTPNRPPDLDPCSRYAWLHGGKQHIYVDMYMVRLLGVDEASYQFSMTFWLLEVWSEDRFIFLPEMDAAELQACPMDARPFRADGNVSSKCGEELWGKQPDLTTGRGRVSLNKAEMDILMQYPVTYYGDMPGFTNVAQSATLAKATFNTDMSFDAFPFDRQNLTVSFLYDLTTEVRQGSTGMHPVAAGFEAAPGWAIDGISGTLGTQSFYLNDLPAAHPYAMGVEGATFENVVPGVFYTLKVSRASAFFIWNLILPVVLLSALSWSSFIMSPSSIDVRLATTMTILIALVAFNFIVNDSLPKTGALTKMHKFLLVSNVLIVLSGLESLLVYYLVEQDISTAAQLKAHLRGICTWWGCRRQGSSAAVVAVERSGTDYADPVGATAPSETPAERAAKKAAAVKKVSRDTVVRGDGVVTEQELENIHRIDRVCAFLFPAFYSVVTAVILAHD
jgi:hypothetical protein